MKILVLQHISIEDPGYIKVLFFIFAGLVFYSLELTTIKNWTVPGPQAVAIPNNLFSSHFDTNAILYW